MTTAQIAGWWCTPLPGFYDRHDDGPVPNLVEIARVA
jgi:hypothetical protein